MGVHWVYGEGIGQVSDPEDKRPAFAALIVEVGRTVSGGDQDEVVGRAVSTFALNQPP